MSKRAIVFLMYHELELPGRPICQDEPGYSRYVLGATEFHSQMEYLKESSWQGLSVGRALSYPEERSVCITFDDGCETDILSAAPTLREFGFGATFFITSGRLGTRGYLSPAQLRDLSDLGFEIGCHSKTHPYLTDLDENGLKQEICDAKTDLEQIIGHKVEHFSCPGGRYDQRVVDTARSAGYVSVSTSRIEANTESTDRFALGRVALLKGLSLSGFAEICQGTRLRRMRTESMLRAAAKRVLGNTLYDRMRAQVLNRTNPPH